MGFRQRRGAHRDAGSVKMICILTFLQLFQDSTMKRFQCAHKVNEFMKNVFWWLIYGFTK